MEHLLFIPDGPQGTVEAWQSPTLATDWSSAGPAMPFQEPRTKWLGFNHEGSSVSSDIMQYPRIRGWDHHQIWQGRLREAHESLKLIDKHQIACRVVALLQSWFYFGLLESIINKPIDLSYFVKADIDDVQYLYSRNLHYCMQAWIFKIRLASEACKTFTNHQILRALSIISDWIRRLNVFADLHQKRFYRIMETDYPGFGAAFSSITPAIIRLGEAVDNARLTAFKSPASSLSWHYPDAAREAQEGTLLNAGWCPYTLQMIESTAGWSTLDWLTTLPRWPNNRESEHQTCDRTKCNRNNIEWENYEIIHQPRCDGTCGFQKPSIEEVLNVLKIGSIPVIQVHEDGNLIVSAQSPDNPGKYIAFSHVWVDGIGSSTEDGLPQCQLRYLHKVAQTATQLENPTFWIDSLCVPRRRSARRQAIIKMQATYENAAEVIVLDKGIKRHELRSPSEVILCAIYTSGWMQRLWTYQEALLARKLTFQFSDGLCTLSPLKIWAERPPSIPSSICNVWCSLFSQLLRLRGSSAETRNIASVSRDLNWRSTAKGIDETLAVAGILRLDVSVLLESSEEDPQVDNDNDEPRVKYSELCDDCRVRLEENLTLIQQRRMIQALIMLTTLPRDIIFLSGPKLPTPNFRWAPLTFMSRSGLRIGVTSSDRATCSKSGLIGEWWVLSLDFPRKADNTSILYVGSTLQRSLYRLFVKESWPAPPQESEFNAVVIYGGETDDFKPGQHRQGLAVSEIRSSQDCYQSYTAVGQILIERLENTETFHNYKKPSIMFQEPMDGVTPGKISWEKICIT